MRHRLYEIVGQQSETDYSNKAYNIFIVIVTLISVFPLMFLHPTGTLKAIFERTDIITVFLLFMDYFLCWMTYDYKSRFRAPKAFFLYPVSPAAILTLLALLPSLNLVPASFAILRLLRLVKILQYSKSCSHIVKVFKKERKTLFSVLVIAIFYIFISALIMFASEGGTTFPNFFDALYWATTALTTVGYGDIYPTTDIGRLISMISSLFGIAIIALPAGIVTAGFVESINESIRHSEELKERRRIQKLRDEHHLAHASELEKIVMLQKKIDANRAENAAMEKQVIELEKKIRESLARQCVEDAVQTNSAASEKEKGGRYGIYHSIH